MSILGYAAALPLWSVSGAVQSGSIIAAAILAWLGKAWVGERIKRDVEDIYNARQQQRKADYDQALEEHKSELSKGLEGWKAGYQKVLDENNIRFSRLHAEQADAIKALYGLLVRMEKKLQALTAPLQYVPEEKEKQKAFFASQRNEYEKVFIACRDSFHESRIFLSNSLCDQFDALLDMAHGAYVDFTIYDNEDDLVPEDRKEKRRLKREAYKTMTDKFSPLRKQLEREFRTAIGLVETSAPKDSE